MKLWQGRFDAPEAADADAFNQSLSFESHKATTSLNPVTADANKLVEIDVSDIRFILKRRYLHVDNACEIFTKDHKSYFFVFLEDERDWFFKSISTQDSSIYIQNDSPARVLKDFDIVRLWQAGKMSNYEYLYWLSQGMDTLCCSQRLPSLTLFV